MSGVQPPRPPSRRTTWVLAGAILVTLALYWVPYGRAASYPLMLLSTFAHEMGHGVAALAVGGAFDSLEMSSNGSGVANLRLPPGRLRAAVASAGGLVGPAFLAGLFFVLARSPRNAHIGLFAFGLTCVGAAAVVVDGGFGRVFAVCLGLGCLGLGLKSSADVAQMALAFMAVQLSLSVFSRSDYLFSRSAGSGPSDVEQMARALLLPYWFWGIVCGAISVWVLAIGVRYFVRAPSRA